MAMTEAEWLGCKTPERLFAHFCARTNQRKRRLFVCACCRRVWHIFRAEGLRQVIEMSELSADGRASAVDLQTAVNRAERLTPSSWRDTLVSSPQMLSNALRIALNSTVDNIGANQLSELANLIYVAVQQDYTVWNSWFDWGAAPREQAALIRHLMAIPFRPPPTEISLDHTVRQLAEAIYSGESCTFALHDALLDTGHAELAAHFRDPAEWHPKGCWALDLILGKS
jgi:hypothetical protein